MRQGAGKICDWLYHAGNRVVRVVGSGIFLWLLWYAMKWTYYINPGGDEIPVNVPDSVGRNLLAAVLAIGAMALLFTAEGRLGRSAQRIWCRVTVWIAMLWVGGMSLWWILAADRQPEGDQAFVYAGASYFLEGDYGFLYKGAYLGMHPHQLGIVALCELLFLFVGAGNYYAIEAFCAVMAVAIVYIGYRLVSELTDRMAVIVGYNLLMLGCLPLIFYTPWCYGDVPSIFCALTAAWMLLLYAKRGRGRYLAVMAAAVAFALLFRKHSLILLVALCIAAVLYAIRQGDMRVAVAALATVALYTAAYQGIYKMYELRSGVEHEPGIPFVCWLAMGMQDEEGARFGWYNNYPKDLYFEMGFDEKMTYEGAVGNLKERIEVFRKDPRYAGIFFREKLVSQWNEPLYQSLFFNTKYIDGQGPAENSLAAGMSGRYYVKMLSLCDRWQFVVFMGMLFYFALAVKKDSNILQHLLGITIIGGFFFSAFYEAKARYIFPYYVMMFPFSAYGYQLLLENAMLLFRSGGRELPAEAEEELEKTA